MTRRLEVDVNGLAIGGFYDDIEGVDTPSNWIEAEQAGLGIGWIWDGIIWSAPAAALVDINILRESRDELLKQCDHVISRHSEQTTLGITTSITTSKYSEWLLYRQELRDITAGYIPVVDPEYPAEPTRD